MKIKPFNKFLKFILSIDQSIIGITLCPFGIYLKDSYLKDNVIINHEKIHWRQQIEMLVIFFYLWYGIEYFVRLGSNPGFSYSSLSFEREAYDNDKNLKYLEVRKPYAWVKYIWLKNKNI